MEWLWNPLSDFFLWTFDIISRLGMNFNYVMMFVGMLLMLYWIGQMIKNRHNDKGLFRKS